MLTVEARSAAGSSAVVVGAALDAGEELESAACVLLEAVALAAEVSVALVVTTLVESAGSVTDAIVEGETAGVGSDGSGEIVVESTVGVERVIVVAGGASLWSERTCVGGDDSTVWSGVEFGEDVLGGDSAVGSAAIGISVVPSAGATPIVSV